MLRNNADARRCSHFELGLPVTPQDSNDEFIIRKLNPLVEGPQQGFADPAFPPFFLINPAIPPYFMPESRSRPIFLRDFLLNYWNRRYKYKTYLLTIVSFDGHFFVRASVHVYFDNFRSPVFLELGRLMSYYDSTALLLVSGDEANSLNCLREV